MSCSKIFSGDLPEITYYIIKNFENDFSTLYSCILINRLWCRLAIPLLWENPFSITTGNYKFIEIYLYNLNSDLKSKLNEYKIYDKLLVPSSILFNYSSFIKHLDTRKIISSTTKWSKDIFKTLKFEVRYLLKDIKSESDFRRLIQTLLFKMFIENENLQTLSIDIFYHRNYDSYQDDMLEIILQNRNFIHNVRSLKLYIDNTLNFSYLNNNEKCTYVENNILQIINIHQNLKKIVLAHDNFPLFQSLLLSKGANCSNTLNTIILYEVNFNGIINLDKIFEQLNVLESVHIIYCFSLNSSFIHQIINLNKPFKLKSLFIDGRSQIDESLKLLLKKSGDYLENFGSKFLLLEQHVLNIIIYCKNIKFLDLYELKERINYLSIDLIENIKQNLSYLSISANNFFSHNINSSSIILRKLGQVLPFKLKYLNLNLIINLIDLEIFLKNSQNTFIEKLLISNRKKNDGMAILPCIKEYIMKKRRVKYLSITNTYIDDSIIFRIKSEDLFSLKDEVKEFELYNIKIQYYDDLFVKVYEFIKEMD